MQSLLIKLLFLLGLISACTSTPRQVTTHPFLEQTKNIELSASQALSLGDYRKSIGLYKNAYQNYSAIDDQLGMQRQLINIAQTALLIEDLILAKKTIDQGFIYTQNNHYNNRLILLSANLAIAEMQWTEAILLLKSITTDSNNALEESTTVSIAVAKAGAGNSDLNISALKNDLSQATSQARLARLLSDQALSKNDITTAEFEINIALDIYRELAFQPGIAESLMIKAKIEEIEFRDKNAKVLRERAKILWQKLDNQRAIKRHNL